MTEGHRRILVVEDDPETAGQLVESLTTSGYHVDLAASGHEALQKAVDWMFLLTVEWFGLPDDLKKHSEQLQYGFKGHSNDELRQIWMSTAVPLCNELQLEVPAHYDEAQQQYVIDCPFPANFDVKAKHWLLEDGSCTWDDVMKRWKARGPSNEEFVGMVQRGKKEMLRLLEQDA